MEKKKKIKMELVENSLGGNFNLSFSQGLSPNISVITELN